LLVKTDEKKLEGVSITDLYDGLNDVTLIGRVITVWPIQEFQRQDGFLGKVMRILIADKSGKVQCVVWNDWAEKLSKIDELVGKILKISHAYTRKGLLNEVEVHCGEKSEIIISPINVNESDYPELKEFFINLKYLSLDKPEVNVKAVIKSNPKIMTFEKIGTTGKVLRARIMDHTGVATLVAWDEKVDELSNLKKGDTIQIMSGQLKKSLSGFPEIHITKRSVVSLLKEKPIELQLITPKINKISELSPDLKWADLLVRVFKIGELKEVKRVTNEQTLLRRLLVYDETGLIKASFWDDNAKLIEKVKEGDILFLEDVTIKERFGRIAISVGKTSSILINPDLEEVKNIPYTVPINKISELGNLKGLFVIEGIVIEPPSTREVFISNETVKITTLIVDDGTGIVKVNFWRNLADMTSTLELGTKIKIIGLVKTGFFGEIELSSEPMTEVKILGRYLL
ncbi:MAG: OB-fold nucleic acid binding domain-containing protein, partial [Candidatus Bathyarchaeia archaeon]